MMNYEEYVDLLFELFEIEADNHDFITAQSAIIRPDVITDMIPSTFGVIREGYSGFIEVIPTYDGALMENFLPLIHGNKK